MEEFDTISSRLDSVRGRIADACARSGRNPDDVCLLAVSKTFPPEAVDEAMRAGQSVFGENKAQEAAAKIPQCGSGAEWHFIGHLQKNKVRIVANLFSVIHSVDSAALYQAIAAESEESGRRPRILLEVNVSGEGSKFGIKPGDLPAVLRDVISSGGPEVCGLMTVPPYTAEPEDSRKHFIALRGLRDKCQDECGIALPELSMGMSGDFEVAVEEGSTIVRVGTAIFGRRVSPAKRMSPDTDAYFLDI